jgi:tetratricopeptide (TPR) repeat protein
LLFAKYRLHLPIMSKIPELESLLEERPDDPFVIYALAREYDKLGNPLQAVLMYEHLVNDHADYIGTYYHYASLLYSRGNRNEAIKLVDIGIEKGSTVKDLHAVSELKSLKAGWLMEMNDD